MTDLNKTCEWIDDEEGIFQTSCGGSFVFTEGTPNENEFKFCCYCSADLKQTLFKLETLDQIDIDTASHSLIVGGDV